MIRELSSTEKCCQFVINFTKEIKYSLKKKSRNGSKKNEIWGKYLYLWNIDPYFG
jgi:hypothetical protein